MAAAATASVILDPDNLEAMVAEGFIAAKPGSGGLTLYNYTPRAQYGRVWNAETTACRGLILREDGSVQARPFSKFFNVQEHADSDLLPPLPVEPFEVFEKMDGSLIVGTTFEGRTLLTTRGSFDSDQAIAAAKLWAERYADVEIPDGETWCFEFIAPWNRIVVDYGDQTDLVLLARLDNATGACSTTATRWSRCGAASGCSARRSRQATSSEPGPSAAESPRATAEPGPPSTGSQDG